jgi:5-formyltetrahydrofolate cyclo-ligase
LLLWFESNGSHRHMRVASPNPPELARSTLRASLLRRRREVRPGERLHAAHLVAQNVERHLHLKAGWRIAVYASLPSELDSGPLIEFARTRGCRVYLPRIDRSRASRSMRFIEMSRGMRRNRLGIEEPAGGAALGARWLDMVFLPLVAFDRHGLRLGTGGGFYDRAFAYRHWRLAWHAPPLIGVGYAFQQLERIAPQAHDVRLDAVVTEEGIIRCTTG